MTRSFRVLSITFGLYFLLAGCGQQADQSDSPAVVAADWPGTVARSRPVPLVNVQADGFLGKRIHANASSIMEGLKSPIPQRFEARVAGKEPGPETDRLAADSDLYKWMEGAAYMLALTGDEKLEQELQRIAGLVIACQTDDGYINTQVPPNVRFDPKVNHDLYNAGHFFEAAVAHFRATGRRDLLDAAIRWADYLIAEYDKGNPYFDAVAEKEHSEYELGLLRLFRATGEKKYLDFATTLARMIPIGPEILTGPYCARGHAVRVNYLLAGYADLCLEKESLEDLDNLKRVWGEIVDTRSYVTGGVSVHERYPKEPYYLPQITDHIRRDIAETCTSISLMMLAWRLHSIEPKSGYFDQIETILYNHYLGALSLDNLATFYYNPLRMLGETEGKSDHDGPLTTRMRLPNIHSTTCCITNEWRFFGALSEYLYSYDDDGLYVNLFTTSRVRQTLPDGREVSLSLRTDYPHAGDIVATVENRESAAFTLRFRVPGWCESGELAVNGEAPRTVSGGGYVAIDRIWRPGDTVQLKLAMPVRMIRPHPEDKLNEGQGVLARGPVVYALEQVDADFPIQHAEWGFAADDAPGVVKVEWRDSLLDGVNVLRAPGAIRSGSTALRSEELLLVPFYARANRSDDNHWVTFLPLGTP